MDPITTVIAACGIRANVELLRAIIEQQSHGDPYAVAITGEPPAYYKDAQAATAAAITFHKAGKDVRLGLAGVPLVAFQAEAPASGHFDKCTNLRGGMDFLNAMALACTADDPAAQEASADCVAGYYGGGPAGQFNTAYAADITARMGQWIVPDHEAGLFVTPGTYSSSSARLFVEPSRKVDLVVKAGTAPLTPPGSRPQPQ